MKLNKYTLYWSNGKREVISGGTISDAYISAGHTPQEFLQIDVICNGDDKLYEWISLDAVNSPRLGYWKRK